MLMSTMSSLNISISISISIRKELMLVSRLSSLAHITYAYVYAYACVASEDRALVRKVKGARSVAIDATQDCAEHSTKSNKITLELK